MPVPPLSTLLSGEIGVVRLDRRRTATCIARGEGCKWRAWLTGGDAAPLSPARAPVRAKGTMRSGARKAQLANTVVRPGAGTKRLSRAEEKEKAEQERKLEIAARYGAQCAVPTSDAVPSGKEEIGGKGFKDIGGCTYLVLEVLSPNPNTQN